MSVPGARVNIIFYSVYHHIFTLAKSVAKGVVAAGGQPKLLQVPETLPKEILERMHAPPRPDVPVATIDDLLDCDGVMFGIPTRYGNAPAQMKAFMDGTGGFWAKGSLQGKTAATFFSTGTQGGGQETTALTFLPNLVHHGMIYVPTGYGTPDWSNMEEIHGGSAYGAGTFAGPTGQRKVSDLEHRLAEFQGKQFAEITQALKNGRAKKN